MSDNIHPAVRLLAKRMESHPEEFGSDTGGRWATIIHNLMEFATPEEKLLLRKARMDEIHEDVIDELLNGEERRAEAERIRKEEQRHYAAAAQRQALQRQALNQQLSTANISGLIGQLNNTGMSAYHDYANNELVTRDLVTGAETRFPVTDIQKGQTGLLGSVKKG